MNSHGCRVSCTGLYADVALNEGDILADMQNRAADLAEKGIFTVVPYESICFLLVYRINPGAFKDGERALFKRGNYGKDKDKLAALLEEYRKYKTKYASNIVFDPSVPKTASKLLLLTNQFLYFIQRWNH